MLFSSTKWWWNGIANKRIEDHFYKKYTTLYGREDNETEWKMMHTIPIFIFIIFKTKGNKIKYI